MVYKTVTTYYDFTRTVLTNMQKVFPSCQITLILTAYGQVITRYEINC